MLAFLMAFASRVVIAISDNILIFPVLEWYFWGFAAVVVVRMATVVRGGWDRQRGRGGTERPARRGGMKVLQVKKFHYNRGGAETMFFAGTDSAARARARRDPLLDAGSANEPSLYARYFVSNIDLREESGGLVGKLAAAARILYSREAGAEAGCACGGRRGRTSPTSTTSTTSSRRRSCGRWAARLPVVMTLHDYKLICPAYTLYTQG